jgi:homospermidine synthase
MEEMELHQKYSDIFNNLPDYVLVGTTESLVILKISTMSFCLIEEDYDGIISLMKKRGVKIVKDAKDVRPKDFEQFHNVWDEEQKIMRSVSQSELNQILEERAKNKGKK